MTKIAGFYYKILFEIKNVMFEHFFVYICKLFYKYIIWIKIKDKKISKLLIMKKLLFFAAVILSPVFAFAQVQQCADTIILLNETFDGTITMTTTNATSPAGDWVWESSLSVSGQAAHAAIPNVGNRSRLVSPPIAMDADYPIYYLSFDHICKVHVVDYAAIWYRYSIGTTPTGDPMWSTYKKMTFTHSSSFYYGSSSNITGGYFNDASYPVWMSSNSQAVPNNTWWKHELIDISSFFTGNNYAGGDGQYFQILFEVQHPESLPTDVCAGWYIDNINLTASTGELAPPEITLQAPLAVGQNANVTNRIGPYQIKAGITDNTPAGVVVDSIKFYYTVNGGPRIYVDKEQVGANPNNWSWIIPAQCYGNVVRYNIEAQDVYCNKASLDTMFQPRFTYTNLSSNAVDIIDFYDQPYALITNNPTPVKVIIYNQSNSVMTSAVFNWTLNGVAQPAYTWNSTTDFHPTNDFCLDFLDTVTIGTYLPIRGYDTIEVCITTRNGSVNTSNYDCDEFVLFACDSIMQGTYTIGSPQADFATLADFYASIDNCGIGGPVVAKLYPGTYSGFSFTQPFPGQSAVNTVTFESFSGNAADVIIEDANTAANTVTGAITLNGVSNLIFNKLTLKGKENATWSRGVCFTGKSCSNITISNCIINIADPTNYTNIAYAGVVRPTAATDNPGDADIRIVGNTITGGNFGVHFLGTNARRNSLTNVDNNTITTIYRGVYSSYTNIATIEKNTLTQRGTYTQFTGLHVERSNNSVSYSKNHISATNPKCGIYLSTVANSATSGVLVSNNEIILKVDGANIYGIQNLTSNNINYINNSVRLYSAGSISGISACYYHTSGTPIVIKNNVFSNECMTVSNQNYPIYLAAIPAALTSDYNVYYSGNGPVGFATVARNTLSEWQYALPNQEANTITTQPTFTAPTTNLSLSNYTGFECPVHPSVTTNIEDQTRVGEITYRGAYSAVVPQNNVAITEMVSPINGACPEASYNVTLRVYNLGGNTINFAATPATIVTTSTGGLTLNETFNLNTGSLAPLTYTDVTVITNLVIPYNSPINFNFVINYSGDNILDNNTLQDDFVLDVIAPLYDEDFSGIPSPAWTIEQVAGAGNWTFQSGAGANPDIAPQFGTGRLFFNSKNFSNTTISRAIMPVANLAGGGNGTPIMEIWFAHDNYQISKADGIKLYISTNNGTTWTELIPQGQNISLIKRGMNTYTTPDWAKYTYDLSNYSNQSCALFAIEGISKAGNNVNIDRVRLRMLPNNDCAVSTIYTTSQRPTAVETSPKVKAVITNEGMNPQTNVQVTLSVTGANTYTETITIPSLAYNSETTVTFQGSHLVNNGTNNLQVSVQTDDYAANDTKSVIITTTNDYVAYADTSSTLVTFGSINESLKIVARYPVNETVIATAVRFYPTNSVEAVGKRVIGFIANSAGEIITTSDTLTIAANQVNSWVNLPINNYALTNLSDAIYAGIEMVDPGIYMTAQAEAPIRDSAYYYMDGEDYEPQTIGRFMIGATLETPITNEFAILSLLSPISDCDLEQEPITIKITNNGSQDIAAGTTLYYQIDNNPVVTETIPEAIPSHQVRTFTFTNRHDFTNNLVGTDVNYNVKVWVNHLAADRIYFNDTINEVIVSRGKSNLPTVQSPVSVSYSTHATLTANYPPQIPAGTGVFQWFTRQNGEWYGPLYEGPGPYVTDDLIFFDTTYYVSVAPGQVYTPQVGTGNTNSSHPFLFTNGYSRGRILYLQSELGAYGEISKISINVATAATGVNGIPIKIYIKETDLNQLPTGAATWAQNWEDEIADATLIFDEQHFFNETGWFTIQLPTPFNYSSGNIMILTESNCGTTNCSACSGTTVYPAFKCTSSPGKVQYKSVNNTPNFTGNATASANRWNMKFSIADIECASEKIPVQLQVPDIPTYDLETVELVHPIPNPGATTQCALGNEHIVVKYKNLLNTTIPAGTVLAKAKFGNDWITHLIMDSFAPLEVKEVVFTQTYDFSIPQNNTQPNRTINFIVTSDCPNEVNVYRGNDTISGTITSTRTTQLPDSLHVTGDFTLPYQIKPTDEIHAQYPTLLTATQYSFYDAEDATTAFATNQTNYTTPQLYDSYTCWIAARTPTSPNCMSKRMKFVIDVAVPNYDIKTNALVSPVNYECGVMNPNLVVNINNTWRAIPTEQFRLVANFTDGTTITQNHVITNVFDSVTNISNPPTEDITFTSPITLGSTTTNHVYDYVIYSEPITMPNPYRNNDTISGTLKVPANPVAPANITLNAQYGQEYTITPNAAPLNIFTFYDATGTTILGEGTSYTTPEIYAAETYKYSGRINDPRFKEEITLGTGSTAGAYPFVFTQPESQGIVLYKAEQLGGSEGYIDTISIYVNNNTTNGSFPCKFYLKNSTLTTLTAGQRNWNTEINGATLIFDGEPVFDQGWLKIPIMGGFHYDGDALLLLTSHSCNGENSVAALNITPPAFRYSNTPGTVLYHGGVATAGNMQFNLTNQRLNTKFSFNYTCPSPQGTITLNTNAPASDLSLEEIIAPTSPQVNYPTNQQVTVKIKNFGTTPASGFTVGYKFENNAPVEQAFSGSIASGATNNFTFTTPVDLSSVYFAKNFTAYVRMNSDNNHLNDTIHLTLSCPDPCAPITTIGANNATNAHISNVTFAGINNVSPVPPILNHVPAAGEGQYTDFTQTVAPAQVVQGQTFPISITNSFTGGNGAALWKYVYIDLNRNNEWESNELVFSATNVTAPSPINHAPATTLGFVTIPQDATTGITRMRVICSQSALNTNPTNNLFPPCAVYQYGETEDYAVNISVPYGVDPGIATILHPSGQICSDNAGKVRVSVMNYGSGPLQLSPDNMLTLTATVTGAVPGTYTTTVAAGTIDPWNSMEVVIPDVNFGTNGSYEVTVTLDYAGDAFITNNEAHSSATVNSTQVYNLPRSIDFDGGGDALTYTEGDVFPSFWTSDYAGNANFIWTIKAGHSENFPNAGPSHDHTMNNTAFQNLGQYAIVSGPNSVNAAAVATLTTSCMNLHYSNGYPSAITYWEHVYGKNANSNIKMFVEVGSGNHFVVMDSITSRTHTDTNQSFLKREIVTLNVDENAQIRFRVTGHSGLIDAAIDDLGIDFGKPDVGVDEFIYPQDVIINPDADCLVKNDTVYPQIRIKNYGSTPVRNFVIRCRGGIGADFQTIEENWSGYLEPGQSIEYTFVNGIVVDRYNFYEFQARTVADLDENTDNDLKTIAACAVVDVPDYLMEDGIILGQNMPNPAIESTIIPYYVSESGDGLFQIHTTDGQLLFEESINFEQGEGTIQVNTANYAAGTYFYTIIVNDKKLTKKMIISK